MNAKQARDFKKRSEWARKEIDSILQDDRARQLQTCYRSKRYFTGCADQVNKTFFFGERTYVVVLGIHGRAICLPGTGFVDKYTKIFVLAHGRLCYVLFRVSDAKNFWLKFDGLFEPVR